MDATPETYDASSEGVAFGPFQLLVRLGVGGMGEVWKAHGPGPQGTRQVVVVKRILTHLAADPEIERSFLREVRLSQRLHHPNVARVFGGGRVGDALYLTMEYLEGVDLHRILRALRERGITPPAGLGAHVAREVCRALAYAYAVTGDDGVPLRVIHRDVTPTNVMVTAGGQVKLLDFGLAKALSEVSEVLTKTGTLKGKFGYMAPEQIDGESARHRSDQFSIGVVLHEALVGERLFRGEHDVQTIFNVKHQNVDAPSLANASVPDALDQICLRSLARDPGLRFRDCAAMATALDPIVACLAFGPTQLAALVSDLFPTGVGGVRLVLPTSVGKHETVVRPATSSRARSGRRWRLVAVAIAIGCVVAMAGWGLLGPRSPAAPSSSARPDVQAVPVERTSTPPTTAATTEQEVQRPHAPAATPRPTPRGRAKTPRPAGSGSNGLAGQRPPSRDSEGSKMRGSANGGRPKSREEIRQGAVVDPFAP